MAPVLDALTAREEAVLMGLAEGRGLREIASGMGVTHWTVRAQRDSAKRKLGCATTVQAVAVLVRARTRG